MAFEVLSPTPLPGSELDQNATLTFDIRSPDPFGLVTVGIKFPRSLPSELAFSANPNLSDSFESIYADSTITPVVEPGFNRWRFTLRRGSGWIGNPTVTVYSEVGVVAFGPTGPTGPVGPPGPTGATGSQGIQGIQGDPGDPGAPGVAGSTGPRGPRGVDGANGDQGERGARGVKGDVGSAGAVGSAGLRGRPGRDGIDGEMGPMGPAGRSGVGGLTMDQVLNLISLGA